MNKLSFKERQWQLRETEILAEAARIIRERGYAEMKLDELAEAVGISKPTLYQHFKSKDDLVAHVLMRSLENLHSYADSLAEQKPLEQIQAILRQMLQARYGTEWMWIGKDAFNAATLNHSGYTALHQAAIQRVGRLIVAAQAAGEIDPSLPIELVSDLLFSTMALPRFEDYMERFPFATLCEQVVMVFTRAVQPCAK